MSWNRILRIIRDGRLNIMLKFYGHKGNIIIPAFQGCKRIDAFKKQVAEIIPFDIIVLFYESSEPFFAEFFLFPVLYFRKTISVEKKQVTLSDFDRFGFIGGFIRDAYKDSLFIQGGDLIF